jgi:Fe-S-cluster containining protein
MAAARARGKQAATVTYPVLLGELNAWFARGAASAGPGVVLCRRGCSACCNGPFDISPADAELVATAFTRLDPATQAAVRSRAIAQLDRYAEVAPEWGAPWNIEAIGDDLFDRVSDALADEPCPALNDHGECLIYESRPATCRMTGLGMTTAQDDVLENVCPILDTSAAFAALRPTLFDLSSFEDRAEAHDLAAMVVGRVITTVAGAIAATEPGTAASADSRSTAT